MSGNGVRRLSHTLFHLRHNHDRIYMKTVLEIFVTFLTVLPNINEGGPVIEDIEQMVFTGTDQDWTGWVAVWE